MTKRRVSLVILLMVAIAIVGGVGWFLFPWPDKTYQMMNERGHYCVTEERRFRWVQRGNPGGVKTAIGDQLFGSGTLVFDGPTWGTEKMRRFGFFEMVDTKSVTAETH